MFREIRTSEKITDRFEDERKKAILEIFDHRIGTKEFEEANNYWNEVFKKAAENAAFDPDKRIIVG